LKEHEDRCATVIEI